MRRRRWASAAALCLAIVFLLQLALHTTAGAAAGMPLSRRARGHVARRWLPASTTPSTALPLHHDTSLKPSPTPATRAAASLPLVAVHHAAHKPSPGGSGRTVAFDATVAADARCNKTSTARKSAAGGREVECTDDDDDDDKRAVPTGPNPLHNR